jgi:AcrR family transcriptional regulator
VSRGVDTRERILAAGTELFDRNGYHGTGVKELSDFVGLGRGALYHHIRSKEELLFEISRSLLENATARAREIVDRDGSPEAKLRELARALVEHHAQHEAGWAVALREARALTPEHRDQIVGERDAYEQIWAEVLAAGAAAGHWGVVGDLELRGVLGMFNSTARWMRADGRLDATQIADRYVDLVVNGIRGR